MDDNDEATVTPDSSEQPETPLKDNAGQDEAEGQSPTEEKPTTPSLDPLAEIEKLEIAPELKKAIKDGYLRQADYTKKTQDIAEARKDAEVYRSLKPYLDRVQQNPALYKAVFNPEGAEEGQSENEPPEDPREYANWVKEQTKAEIREEIKQESDYKAAEQVDPRLMDPEFAKVIAGYVAQDTDFTNNRKSAVQATRDAIASWSAYEEKQRKAWRDELNKKATEKKYVTPASGSPGHTKGKKAATMEEAAAQAEAELSS